MVAIICLVWSRLMLTLVGRSRVLKRKNDYRKRSLP